MTKEERLAYQCGQNAAQQGVKFAPVFDSNMRPLIRDPHTKAGDKYNQRNVRAWYEGYVSHCKLIGGEIADVAQKAFDGLFIRSDGIDADSWDYETRITLNHQLDQEQPVTGGMNQSMTY